MRPWHRSSGRRCCCPCQPNRGDQLITRLRAAAAGWALRRARRGEGPGAESWFDRAARWSPWFSHAHGELISRLLARGEREAALAAAQRTAGRFPSSPQAWVLLGTAYQGMYKPRDALVAYEQALMIEERPDAAMAAGALYRQLGDAVNAGARFARAYAAGAGPDALRANAEMLRKAGDHAAADAAERRWQAEAG